jgi:glycosyltransferase involved in cell wall biosynthesis
MRASIAGADHDVMKVVVFAHTPPPFHGQSYMVKLMLAGLREAGRSNPTRRLQLFHVDAKLSSNLETIGKFRWSKVLLLLKYCFKAWRHRFTHQADAFYYIPAPGKRNALYRDWIVMFFCRPIFKKIILHWHAVGLGEWIEKEAVGWERWITYRLLGGADLSIVLSEFGRADAMRLFPRKIDIVANGIPDPCPDFDQSVLPERQRRFRERNEGRQKNFTVLFVGACTAAKGVFATLDAVAILNQRWNARRSLITARLIIAGDFASPKEREQFQNRIRQPDLNGAPTGESVSYEGFVAGEAKNKLFRKADCLCFPTRYAAEGQPVTILEALAFGLSIVATRWRGIPELLAGSEAQLIDNQDPASVADSLEKLAMMESAISSRKVFFENYRLERFVDNLQKAIATIAE